MSYKIITHNGKAHMDELLGSALLALHIGEEPVSYLRMDSQEAAELVEEGNLPEDTYFIDCGLIFDSNRKLYDHHQDGELDSTALLLFDELFPHLHDTDLHKYMVLVSKVDTKGPMSLNDFELIGESRDYFNFGHKILLKSFEENPMPILRIFIAGLDDKIRFEVARTKAASWLREDGHIEIVEAAGLNVLRYLVTPPSELVSPLRSAIGAVVDENNVSAILSFDDKQPGVLTYYRTDSGHDLVNFAQCSPSKTIFCHPGGFLMKFAPSDDGEWLKLIKQAVAG